MKDTNQTLKDTNQSVITSPKNQTINSQPSEFDVHGHNHWKTEDKRTPAALEQVEVDETPALTVVEYQPNGKVRMATTAAAQASKRTINNLKDYVYWKNSIDVGRHKSFVADNKHFERLLVAQR